MERIRTIHVESGPCRICGTIGPLTEDHIPPKGIPRMGKFMLHALTDTLGSETKTFSPRLFQNGVFYKTICETCNSTRLGNEYDPSLITLCKDIENASKSNFYLPKSFYVPLNRVARSFVGHTLAHSLVELKSTSFLDSLVEYFLNPHKIFRWDFPHIFGFIRMIDKLLAREFRRYLISGSNKKPASST
jgi:hypothetical protein